ncbi:hypothetical protein LCGC14_1080410 [marine sediment metagenome]|uniref:Uncharacterized protein n=1 Tax=marine sediment metagenome TaxID=412755 RepID=A0A0F9QLA1_9ZZZZ
MTKCMYEGCTEPGTQMEQGPFSDMWVCAGCAEKIRRHREAWIRAREGMTLGERARASLVREKKLGPGNSARGGTRAPSHSTTDGQ